MEDAHSVVLKMKNHDNASFFGVFDGHSGSGAAHWCSQNLFEYFEGLESFDQDSITSKCLEADEKLIDLILSYV